MGEKPHDTPVCGWCDASLEGAEAAGARRLHCNSCGADTTWPRPSSAELDQAYGGWYRPESGRFSGPGDRLLRYARARLAVRLDGTAPPGPMLDVGSGDGTLVEALRARGREAVGTERAEDGAAVPGGAERWSSVVLWHSLEHLPESGAEVDRLPQVLAPGGVVIVSMPNSDSLQAKAFGDRWLHLDLPRHVVHVPAPALLQRLSASGLEIERVSHLRGGQVTFGWLHGLVGMLPGHPHLYDAIRRTQARSAELPARRRMAALAAAAVLLPLAVTLALIEAGLRRGGTIYVEARRV